MVFFIRSLWVPIGHERLKVKVSGTVKEDRDKGWVTEGSIGDLKYVTVTFILTTTKL